MKQFEEIGIKFRKPFKIKGWKFAVKRGAN
jgi:hypothetical protein